MKDSVLDRPAPKRVTISDVATRAGVSKGTVSRALSGYPDIADATRARIRKIAGSMGYSPLATAQAIRTGRSRALGLVLEMDAHDRHSAFLADFLAGISQGASVEGWTLTVATAQDETELLRTIPALVAAHKADGFILQRTGVRDRRVELLADMGVPFILYGRTKAPGPWSWFDISGESAMAGAVDRLVGLGHRRVGFIASDPAFMFSHLRRGGYGQAMADAGLDPLVAPGGLTEPEGRAAADHLLDQGATALVAATDALALGAYGAITARGLRVGRDVSVIGYDGSLPGAAAQPALTTYAVDMERAGRRLAHLLIRQLRGEPPEQLREVADARLRQGGSDGPPPQQRPRPTRAQS